MTANGNVPPDPAQEAVRAREDLAGAAEASAAKADDLKGRAQKKAVQAKDTIVERTGHAAQATRDKLGQTIGQTKKKASDLASIEDGAPTITSPPAVRGVTTAGLAIAVAVWLLRRRARRNANPWQAAAKDAKSQIKRVRKQAKSGLNATRKRSSEEAAFQVAAAKAKAHKARAKAKSWT